MLAFIRRIPKMAYIPNGFKVGDVFEDTDDNVHYTIRSIDKGLVIMTWTDDDGEEHDEDDTDDNVERYFLDGRYKMVSIAPTFITPQAAEISIEVKNMSETQLLEAIEAAEFLAEMDDKEAKAELKKLKQRLKNIKK